MQTRVCDVKGNFEYCAPFAADGLAVSFYQSLKKHPRVQESKHIKGILIIQYPFAFVLHFANFFEIKGSNENKSEKRLKSQSHEDLNN